jgi:DNA-binding XRE family transcriptional regulator
VTTRLQAGADRRSAAVRRALAEDLQRMREDAGLTRATVGRIAGVHPSAVGRIEDGSIKPSLETVMRLAVAIGADLHARVYPGTGPAVRDRHQVRIAELLGSEVHPRWAKAAEVAVRRPARGFIDVVLRDPLEPVIVATELESDLRRIEQLLRWSQEKAASLPSADAWPTWSVTSPSDVSRLLVVRHTRANRAAAAAARRQLRDAFPADPEDALAALRGTARWPGAALVWARLDAEHPRLST